MLKTNNKQQKTNEKAITVKEREDFYLVRKQRKTTSCIKDLSKKKKRFHHRLFFSSVNLEKVRQR